MNLNLRKLTWKSISLHTSRSFPGTECAIHLEMLMNCICLRFSGVYPTHWCNCSDVYIHRYCGSEWRRLCQAYGAFAFCTASDSVYPVSSPSSSWPLAAMSVFMLWWQIARLLLIGICKYTGYSASGVLY